MAIGWESVITAGVVSAVVGGGVSWLTARRLAVKKIRAEKAEVAREQISAVVGPLLQEIRQYQHHSRSTAGRDRNVQRPAVHLGDVTKCARLLIAAEGLPWLRRRLVRRRCARLFGKGTVATCDVHGGDAADQLKATGVALSAAHAAKTFPGEGIPQCDTGLLDAGLRSQPNSAAVSKLVIELTRLHRAR